MMQRRCSTLINLFFFFFVIFAHFKQGILSQNCKGATVIGTRFLGEKHVWEVVDQDVCLYFILHLNFYMLARSGKRGNREGIPKVTSPRKETIGITNLPASKDHYIEGKWNFVASWMGWVYLH